MGKVFHRAGTANEKLLSAPDCGAFLRNFGTERRVVCSAKGRPVRVQWP